MRMVFVSLLLWMVTVAAKEGSRNPTTCKFFISELYRPGAWAKGYPCAYAGIGVTPSCTTSKSLDIKDYSLLILQANDDAEGPLEIAHWHFTQKLRKVPVQNGNESRMKRGRKNAFKTNYAFGNGACYKEYGFGFGFRFEPFFIKISPRGFDETYRLALVSRYKGSTTAFILLNYRGMTKEARDNILKPTVAQHYGYYEIDKKKLELLSDFIVDVVVVNTAEKNPYDLSSIRERFAPLFPNIQSHEVPIVSFPEVPGIEEESMVRCFLEPEKPADFDKEGRKRSDAEMESALETYDKDVKDMEALFNNISLPFWKTSLAEPGKEVDCGYTDVKLLVYTEMKELLESYEPRFLPGKDQDEPEETNHEALQIPECDLKLILEKLRVLISLSGLGIFVCTLSIYLKYFSTNSSE